jgi:hypothetical protein
MSRPAGRAVTYVGVLCAVLTWVVLSVSAVSKVRSRSAFTAFASSLPSFGVPVRLARPLAAGVAAAETSTAAALAVSPCAGSRCAVVALLAATALFAVFTSAVLVALRRRVRATCNCFGSGGTSIGPAHVVRNILLITAAATAAATVTPAAGHPVGLAAAAVAGAVLAGLVSRWDDLTYLLFPAS